MTRSKLSFKGVFNKISLLFALLVTISLNANAQGLFTPVASAVSTGGNCYRLTTETVSDRGAVWNNTKISLLSSFDISFTFNFGTRSGFSGGDGMAFVLQPAGLTQIGVAGSAKGYANNYDGSGNITTPGISPSVVVEYDNYDDNGGTDALLSLLFNGDHRRTNPANVGVPQSSIGFVNDGSNHAQRVTWNASTKTMTVYTDALQRFTYTRDFVTDIFSGQDEVYFGFTAATGGSVNQYSVCYNAELSTFGPAFTPTLGQILDACAGGSTGSATINLQGGTNPFIVALNGISNVFTQSNITSNSVTFSNLPADVYSVRILESNGFENNDLSFTINDNPIPTITASGPLNLCTDSSVTLTASPAGISYLWNNGATSQSITVSAAGTYDVDVTYALGCGPTNTAAPTIVTLVPTPNFPDISSPNQSGYLCAGETAVINITNVEPGVTYQWYYAVSGGFAFMQPIQGETGTSITVSSIGQYAVKASKNCGTIFSMGYQFNAATLQPPPTISASGTTTFCAGGSVTLTSSSPIGNTWSTGETTQSITVTNSGSYSVTLFSGNCASTSVPTVVTVDPALETPSFFALDATEFCEGGSVTITVANVQPGVSYQWWKSVGGAFANPMPGATGPSFTVTSTGRYTVFATNSCGTIASGTYLITVKPLPTVSSVTGSTQICFGATSTLTANSTASSPVFKWYNNSSGGTALFTGAVFTTPSLVSNTTYYVEVTDVNACTSATREAVAVTVTASLPPPTISASRSLVLCAYNSVDLTSSAATGNTWSNGATTQTITVTPATVGSYTVSVFNGACSTTSAATVVSNAEAFVSNITASGPTLICTGNSVTYTLNEVVPSVSRTWSRYINESEGYDPEFNETGLSIVVTKSGNYSVNILASNGCYYSPPGAHQVTVLPPPTKSLDFTVSGTNACTINSGTVAAQIDFSSGVAPINMTWSDGNGFTTFAQSVNNIPPGTYTATVYDYCGTTVVKTVNITGAVTAATITATATMVCTGATTTINVTNIDPLLTYQWYKDGGIINGATGTTYDGSAGNYQVLASDGSCTAFSASLFISERIVTAPLDFTVTSSNSCGGPNTGMIDQGPFTGGGFSYVNLGWTGPNGFFRDDVSRLDNLAAGTYTLGVRDFCGTVVSKTVTILQGTSFDQNLTISGSPILCVGGSVRITGAPGATVYSWNKTINGIVTNNFANTQFVDATEAGFYTLNMTDAIGCVTSAIGVTIFLPNSPLQILAQGYNSCNGSNNGSAVVTLLNGGNAPYTVNWSNGAGFSSSNFSINGLSAGTYTVTGQDNCLTQVSTQIIISEPVPQDQNVTVSGGLSGGGGYYLCAPETTITLTASSGSITYTWIRDVNGVQTVVGSGQSLVVTQPGGYYVSMTDAEGCFQNSFWLNIYAANPIPLTVALTSYTNGVSCFNGGGVVNADFNGGTAPHTFVGWTGPNGFTSTNNNIGGLAPGTYIATYRDFCGFEATGSITFTAGEAFVLPTVTSSAPFCGSNSVTLTMGATPYSFEWYKYDLISSLFVESFSPNQNTIVLPADAGYYYYPVLKDANNCFGYPTGFSTISPTPLSFSVSSSVSCGNNNGTANIFNITGGKIPVTYSWTDGASFNSTDGFITNLAPGTYTVTAIDACSNAVSQSVTITGGVTAATITSTSTNLCSGSSAVLSITNYNAAYTYQWRKDGVIIPAATSESYSASEQGNYQVEVSNGICNSFSGSIFISVSLPPSLTVFVNPSCGSPNVGSAYIQSVSGGRFPFTYVWTDGGSFSSTANFVNNLPAGNYSVTVTDACGQQDNESFTINQLPLVTGTISGVTAICSEGGSTTLTASTNGTPSTFAWSKTIAGITTFDISSANTLSASETGTYWVNIRDVNGCFSTPTIYVTAAGTPLNLTLTGNPSCGGPSIGNVGASFSGAAPITVAWTDGGSFSSTANFINNIPGGTYTATATDACGVSVSKVITIASQVTSATITATATSICAPDSSILSVTNVGAGLTYQWRNNGVIIDGATGTTYSATISGNYQVTASNGVCSSTSSSIFITVNTYPAAPVITIPGSLSVCPSTNTLLTTSSFLTNYRWTIAGSVTSITTTVNFNQSIPGNYDIVLSTASGICRTNSVPLTMTVTALPITYTVSGGGSYCTTDGRGVYVKLMGSQIGVNYTLFRNGITTGSLLPGTGDSLFFTNITATGSYTIRGTNAAGCTSFMSGGRSITITQAPIVNPIVTASGSTNICENENVTLAVSTIAGTNLRFNGSNYLEAPSAAGNSLSTALTVELWFKTDNAAATQYLVSKGLEDGSPGHYGLVLVNSGVQLHLGGAGSASINSVTKLKSNIWYHVAGTWDGATGIAKLYVNGLFEGQVETGLNSNLGTNTEPLQIGRLGKPCCPYLFSGEMDELRIWNIARDITQIASDRFFSYVGSPINLVANYHLNNGTGTVATDSAPGGSNAVLVNSPTWEISSAPLNSFTATYLWSNGETTPTITTNQAGSYTATVTYTVSGAGGCTATGTSTIPLIVTVLPSTATITASGSLSLLPGQSVTLTANDGSAYLWSNGATTQSITVNTATVGTFTVSVTNGSCDITSAPTVVSVNTGIAPVIVVPSAISVNNDPGTCGAIVNFVATETTGIPASTITYSHAPGSVFPVGTTVVTATATNTSGISSNTFSITVTDNEKPSFVIISSGTATITIPAMQTIVSSCAPSTFNFVDPLPTGAVVTGIDLTYSGQDQGWGGTDGNDDLYVSGTRVASSIYKHETLTFNTTFTGSIPGYVYGGNNVFGFVFTCYPGWQGFINGGTMTIRYKSSLEPITVNAETGKIGASVSLSNPSTSDNCGVAGVTNDAPAFFPVGTTIVTWTVNDINGNSNTTTQTVTVIDNQPPVINCIDPITKNNDLGRAGANVDYVLPVVNDNVSSVITLITEGSGDNAIEFTTPLATNVNGINFVSSGAFNDIAHGHGENITVVIELFNPLTNSWTSVKSIETGINDFHFGGTSVSFMPAMSQVSKIRFSSSKFIGAAFHFYELTVNLNSAVLVQKSGLSSGDFFPLGVTTNTFEAQDQNSNVANCSFTVTVVDNEKPEITNLNAFTLQNVNGNCSWTGSAASFTILENSNAPLTLTAKYIDKNGQASESVQTLAKGNGSLSGFGLPVGANTVILTAKDAAGNESEPKVFIITIVDNVNPVITPAANITRPAILGRCGAFVTVGLPTISDNCGIKLVSNNSTISANANGFYPVGVTQVVWTVTDINNNTVSATQTITINDNEPPIINTPVNIDREMLDDGTCTAAVSWSLPKATDNCAIRTLVASIPSGSRFPIGQTVVTYTATDVNNNVSTTSFNVTVRDKIAPVVRTKPYTITLVNGAAVLNASDINNGSTDNCTTLTNTNLWISKTLFTCADIGDNTVTLNVTDAGGNTGAANAVVTVIGQVLTSSIVPTPENAIYTGGNATNIYLGYGPQRLTLSDNVVGATPITYVWTAGEGLQNLSSSTIANPVFTATIAGSYTYSVKATNQYGCNTISTVSICVRDIRVPNSTSNVYVCESGIQFSRATNTLGGTITPLTPQNVLGPCGMSACIVAPTVLTSNNTSKATQEVVNNSKALTQTNNLSVKVLPNPTVTEFTFIVNSIVKTPARIRMIDAAGRSVEELRNVTIGIPVKMGNRLLSGMYFAEVIQGNERVVLKLIKEK